LASNTTLNAGTGGDVITTKERTHDGDATKQQVVSIAFATGSEGSYTHTDAVAGAGAVGAGVQRVTLASDDPAVTALQLIDNAVSGSGFNITQLNGVNITMGNGASGTGVQRVTLANDSTGVIASITSSVTPGTAAANLGKAEDAAHASGDVGVMALTVRQNTAAALSGTDGDYQPLITDTNGRLHVNVGAGGIAGVLEDAASAGGEEGILAMAVRQDTLASSTSADGDFTYLKVNANGALHVTGSAGTTQYAEDAASAGGESLCLAGTIRQDTIASSTSADGDYANTKSNSVGALYTSLSHLGANAVSTGNGTAGTGCQRVTIASDNTAFTVVDTGPAAHDAAISGNPVRVAARGMSADYTAVTTGDVADILATLLGKLVVQPYALPGNTWSYAAASGGIVNTTGVTAKTAAGAGIRNYVTHAQVINGHATVSTDVQIRDGASGTVLHRGFAQAAGAGYTCKFDPPLRGTANTLIEVACGTTGSAVYVNLQGYVAAE
jgi:hypothetical protein